MFLMKMAKIQCITIPKDKRIICISDIHGNLDLFIELLEKVNFTDDDTLILLGDLFMRGKQCHETLKYIIGLSEKDNVYAIMGNWDMARPEYLTVDEIQWLEALPQIIEAQDYIFVHGGVSSEDFRTLEAYGCMKNDNFMERQGLSFSKYVVTGHWPTNNYCHKIPCRNPVVNEDKKIIAIDGGNVINNGGQLNAFIILNNKFSYDYVDGLSSYIVEKTQVERGGSINITWEDRFVELVDEGDSESLYRHLGTGAELLLPNGSVWEENDGRISASSFGTDYYLPLDEGETVSIVKRFEKRLYVKKNGLCGWVEI